MTSLSIELIMSSNSRILLSLIEISLFKSSTSLTNLSEGSFDLPLDFNLHTFTSRFLFSFLICSSCKVFFSHSTDFKAHSLSLILKLSFCSEILTSRFFSFFVEFLVTESSFSLFSFRCFNVFSNWPTTRCTYFPTPGTLL